MLGAFVEEIDQWEGTAIASSLRIGPLRFGERTHSWPWLSTACIGAVSTRRIFWYIDQELPLVPVVGSYHTSMAPLLSSLVIQP
jgi:hypothetical protein